MIIRHIPIADMPKKYQIQYPRGVRELVNDLRSELPEGATRNDAEAIIADLSFEIRDKRLGIYGLDSHQITYERHCDWQTHIENAALDELFPENPR